MSRMGYLAPPHARDLCPSNPPLPPCPLFLPQRLFEQYVDANAVVARLQNMVRPNRMTPKMFMHTLKSMCK